MGIAAGVAFISARQDNGTLEVPTRLFEKTGEHIPILGLGGWTIGKRSVSEKDGLLIMHEAIDRGLRFFDNCWEYNDGVSEQRMGKAIADGWRRDKVFLMTKTCARLDIDARTQLEDSLRRLGTDYIDLWMIHGIRRFKDRELVFSDEGMMKTALRAKEEGKIRYIGFSGHEGPQYHLNMLAQDFDWDFVLMPVNVFDYHYRSFQKEVLPLLNERKIGVIGMKSLLAGRLPQLTNLDVRLCRRYALSMPINTLLCGIETREQLNQDIGIANNFSPLTSAEMEQLLVRTEKQGLTGEMEQYKKGKTGCDWHYDKYQIPAD